MYTTPQVQVPSTQRVVPSTPQIVPQATVVEKPVIQEFVPPALNKLRQKKSKRKPKARALTAAELAEQLGIFGSAAGVVRVEWRLRKRHK